MKISARNVLKGTIVEVTKGATTSHVKIDVNGAGRHPLYAELTTTPDADGTAGDVQWNFEKFLVGPDGTVLARFRPRTEPMSREVTAAIEAALG